MTQKEKLRIITDVAFNNNIDKVLKASFNGTIDVQFGVYNKAPCKGWATINLKPSKGWRDWMINIVSWADKEGLHKGYHAEWEKYRQEFLDYLEDVQMQAAMEKGLIIAGRSKGGAEALIIAEDIFGMVPAYRERMLVGAIEPPHMCDRDWAEIYEIFIPRQNTLITCWHNDIVPELVPWLTIPGQRIQLGERGAGLSIRDHEKATTQEELIYKEIEAL